MEQQQQQQQLDKVAGDSSGSGECNSEEERKTVKAAGEVEEVCVEDTRMDAADAETVKVVVELKETTAPTIEVEIEDCGSESDSRSTPTKNDKSSSDSGVCSKMEEDDDKRAAGTDHGVTTVALIADTVFDHHGGPGLPAAMATDGANDTAGVDTSSTEGDAVMIDFDSGCEPTCSASSLAAAAGGDGDMATDKNENADKQAPKKQTTWSRSSRRNHRNYRRNMPTDDDDDDDDDEDDDDENSAAANGEGDHNEEAATNQQNPNLLLPSAAATDSEQSTASDMPSEGGSSFLLASLRAAGSPPRPGSSPFILDSISSFNDDDDDDDDDDDEVDSDDDDVDDEQSAADKANHADALAAVMNKPKPPYTWNLAQEVLRREHGLSSDGRRSLRNGMPYGFNTRFYSSRHVIERMKLSHTLSKHNGCVNCLNFNRSGDLLCSGSDDTRIIVWHWAQKKVKHVFKSGHTENIFQTKFIDSVGILDIVSASRDGQVRRSIIPPSGGKPMISQLYRHHGSVHKLVVSPRNPFEILSAGEDGHIRRKDLRSDDPATSVCKVENNGKKRKIRLFSIAHNPYAPEVVVCGCDNFVRVYDTRKMAKAVHQMCPEQLVETSIPQVTCAVYNSTGSEVLASYSDDHIYLFNNVEYKTGEYLHRYQGHYNHKTIKGVNFFGPNSEYVISGSDCGNIFFWDKNTEAIINFMQGDMAGVVNCLEPHPSIPVLATSGLDHNIKIWTPSSEVYPPDLSDLEQCVKRNLRRSVIDESTEFGDQQFHYFIRQFLRAPRRNRSYMRPDFDCSDSSSSSSSDEYDCPNDIQCHTQ